MSSSADSDGSKLRIIVGPTAAGKSAIAMSLAEEFGAAIISADSRQIYRGFDVGTAKPSPADRARVPHFGIDVAEPTERWSAARFASEAAVWLQSGHRALGERGHRALGIGHSQRLPCPVPSAPCPLVVGGTGFWIKSLVEPLASVPEIEPSARTSLDSFMATLSNSELKSWCLALDPPIARHGPAQWRRAIQVALLTGQRLSDMQAAHTSTPRAVRYLLIDPGTALERNIVTRIDAMFAAGWADEVRALSQAVPADAIAWKACGYELLRQAIDEGKSVQSVRDAVIIETRQYAKRQRTWFRKQLVHGPVTMIDPTASDALDRARAWWRSEE